MSNSNRAARTRKEILDAAWSLIAARGAEVSLAEIAKAVGITRQSVYVHFGSRGGLLMALVRRTDEREGIFETFDQAMTVQPAAERFDACLRVWLAFVVKIHPVARDLIRLRSTDPDAAEAWEDRMKDALQLFRRLVRSLAEEDALAPGWSVPRAADFLWAACSVQAWELLVGDRGWSHAAASKTIRHSMARSLLA